MNNKTNAVHAPVCVYMYIDKLFLVAYQKNLPESHDLGLEKKKFQLRSNFSSYGLQTPYKIIKMVLSCTIPHLSNIS